jgi:hypothetical protein
MQRDLTEIKEVTPHGGTRPSHGRGLPLGDLETLSRVCSRPCFAKRSRSFSLIDCISVGVDRMQRNFESMRKQVEAWQKSELTHVTAKVVIYEAFVEGRLEAPQHLARVVHDLAKRASNDRPIAARSGLFVSNWKAAFSTPRPLFTQVRFRWQPACTCCTHFQGSSRPRSE